MPSTDQRQAWMDLLRGVAVLLIVVYHAAYSVVDVGVSVPAVVTDFNDLLAPFRIPMLVFLSGLLLPASLRKGTIAYFHGKVSNVAWPYLVWLVPHTLIKDDADPLKVLLGDTQLWFLLFLGFYYVLAWCVRRVPPPIVVAAACVLSAVAPGGEKYGERLWFLFACFVAGQWAASRPLVWRRLREHRGAMVISLVVLGGYLTVAEDHTYGLHSVAGTMAGVLLACQVAPWFAARSLSSPLRAAGRESLTLYVAHAVGMHLMMLFAAEVGWTSAPLLLAASLCAGLAVPVALVWLKRRWRPAHYLFTLTPKDASSSPASLPAGHRQRL